MNKPLVSIVVPVYNAELFLEHAVESVKAQSYEHWELILVNDKSTDRSVELIEQLQKNDSRIKLINMKENGGAALARNKGIHIATGRFLAFLDADDFWVNEKLAMQVSFMLNSSNPQRAFTFSSYDFVDKNGKPRDVVVRVPAKLSLEGYLKNNIIWTTTVMIDLKYISKDKVYMKDISYGEDALAWIEILKDTKYAYGLDTPLASYRRGSSSLSSNKVKAVTNKFRLYQNIDELNSIAAAYYFARSIISATLKRI